ncbi:MAG: hypothetical protein GX443_13755 [Deltaproteobacteria bacterium]|nr:hypothetical protein [Deltaproteobacteria bacterium]
MQLETKSVPRRNRTGRKDQVFSKILQDKRRLPMPPYLAAKSSHHSHEARTDIIENYLAFLEQCSLSVAEESELPYPKQTIRDAIREEIQENPCCEMRNSLEIAYVQLETFLPPDEYRVLTGFQLACAITQEIAKSGSPADIIVSSRLLDREEGARAVQIQERLSERIRKRQKEISSIC